MRSFQVGIGRVVVVGALLAISGCTSITASRTSKDDYSTEGIRYWLPMPYLLVTQPIDISRKDTLCELDGAALKCGAPASAVSSTTQPQGAGVGNRDATGKRPDNKDGDGDGEDKPKKPDTRDESPLQGPGGKGVEIIWLPDYCHQYAIRQRSFLAKLEANLSFTNGWMLGSANAKADSTEFVGKILDTIGTIKGAQTQPPSDTKQPQGNLNALQNFGSAAEGQKQLFVKSTLTRLKPGIYRLFDRTECNAHPTFTFQQISTEDSVTVTRLAEPPAAQIPARPPNLLPRK